jgi:hypothetical protein
MAESGFDALGRVVQIKKRHFLRGEEDRSMLHIYI